MQTREQRGEKTVLIATAPGLFCLVIAVGGLGLWIASSLLGMSDSAPELLVSVLTIAAGVLLVVYLVRAPGTWLPLWIPCEELASPYGCGQDSEGVRRGSALRGHLVRGGQSLGSAGTAP